MQIRRQTAFEDPTESLDSLLVRLQPKLLGIVGKYGVPAQDAEDLIQQTLLAFVHKRSSIRSPEVWLVGALKKQCLLYLRTRRRQLYDALDAALLDLVAEPRKPDQEQTEVAHDLEKAITRIPERCQSLLNLRYRQGYEPAELASTMGYRLSSIRKVTTRCLAALTRQMVGSGYEKDGVRA